MDKLAEAMLVVAEKKGLAVKLPERRRPYTKAEAAAVFGLNERTIANWIEAKLLDRISGCGTVLITAESVRQRCAGER